MVGRWSGGGREVVGRWSEVVGGWSESGRRVVGRWSEGGRSVVGRRSEIGWRWSFGGCSLVLKVWYCWSSRISIFGSCSAILHVVCFLSTVYILSDQQAARISHLQIQQLSFLVQVCSCSVLLRVCSRAIERASVLQGVLVQVRSASGLAQVRCKRARASLLVWAPL